MTWYVSSGVADEFAETNTTVKSGFCKDVVMFFWYFKLSFRSEIVNPFCRTAD